MPLRHATRAMAPRHDLAVLGELHRVFRALRPDDRAHPQPEAGGVRPPRRARRARTGDRQHGPRPLRDARRPVREAGGRLRARAARGHVLPGRAGPEPRGRPHAAPPRDPRTSDHACSATASTSPASGPTGVDVGAGATSCAAARASRPARSWSARSAASCGRRATARCSRPPVALRETDPHLHFVVVGGLDEAKADQLDRLTSTP